MSSPAAPVDSAFGGDALFFHNPPSDEGLLRSLFVGREAELGILHARLPGTMPGTIRAIHGESRVGKSHLALRFLADLHSVHVIAVGAASGKRARLILRDLYAELRTRLYDVYDRAEADSQTLGWIDPNTRQPVPADRAHDGAVKAYQDLHAAIARIEQMDDLLEGLATSRETASTEGDESSAGVNVLPHGIGVSGGAKTSHSQGDKLVHIRPDEDGMSTIIAQLCQALYLTTGKRVLIYVDDVDLLDTGPGADPEQVVLLIRCLHRLSKGREVAVVASLRTRHMRDRDKEFSDVVRVRRLKDSELRQIYDRHIQHFNNGQPVMDAACLDDVIVHSGGKVGSFLRLCFQLRDYGLLHRPQQVLGTADLVDFFAGEIRDELLSTPDFRPYVKAVVDALKGGSLEVELDAGVQNTPIVYMLLEESPAPMVPRRYAIAALAAKALRMLYPSEFPPPPSPSGSPS